MISFPVVFASVRNIPAQMYSVMILASDPEGKIQGMVPYEDTRYMEMDEFLKVALGRFFEFFSRIGKTGRTDLPDTGERLAGLLLPSIRVQAAEDISEADSAGEMPWGSGLSPEDPVWTDENYGDSVNVRWAIYKTYLSRLNFSGHESSEDGVWLKADSSVPHAHNFLLQIMFSHGVVTGLLFLAILALAFLFCLVRCFGKRRGSWYYIVGVLTITSFVGFGTLEVDWRLGQLSFTTLFIVLYLLLHRCPEIGAEPDEGSEELTETE